MTAGANIYRMSARNVLLALTLLSVAAAQTPQTTADLDTVLVIGNRPAEAVTRLAGSVDVIGRDELEYQHVDDTMELLTKVPGTYMSRFNQGIINSDVAIRGFAADGSTPHVKLLIDGIPSNLHGGYSEMDQLFPRGIGSVQVFKGLIGCCESRLYGAHSHQSR